MSTNTPTLATPLAAGAPAREALTYRGERLRALTLPLGGIGTGTISLAGDGGLRQWQIVNNVNHDAYVPNSFFAIWAGTRRDARRNAYVLQSDKLYDDANFKPAPSVSDHLIPEGARELLRQLPGVDDLSITAQYPIAEVDYECAGLPVDVHLEAFNPFVPLNSYDSGLPLILFNFTITNPKSHPVRVSLLGSQQNLVGWDGKTSIDGVNNFGYGGNVNQIVQLQGITALDMHNTRLEPDHPNNGQVTLAAFTQPGDEVSTLPQWEDLSQLWDYFGSLKGRLPDRGAVGPSPEGKTWNGALAIHFALEPGESRTVTFVLAWRFPNRFLSYAQDTEPYQLGIPDRKSRFWLGNLYAQRFPSALAAIQYMHDHYDRLVEQTRLFRDRFFDSTLPWQIAESAIAPASTIRTQTCIWPEDGRLYGYEGCHGASTHHGVLDGCCPMNCTHVWNYEMALAKLYPDLEQSMRRTDLIEQISPWGSIPHRTVLPLYLPRPWKVFIGGPGNPAMDGEFGTVLKTYREIRHGAGRAWFDEMWPGVKQVMDHAMRDYDTEGDGVIRGEQPNTYDISIFGPNTFIGSLYLAALRAAEEMAKLQGENDLAAKYRERFELGRENYDRICWNGEYYAQIVDLEKHVEMQFGTGCHIDQLLGQWWAFLLDLGYVLPADHVLTTIRNVYRNNRRTTFRIEDQRPRVYMDERDRGLYICTWPHGGKPAVPTLYSDEVWSGLEYPMAAMLLHEGEVDAALTILEDIRDRHDGSRRSPWNEIECGDHYARAMAGWSLLEVATGYQYDALSESITFAPRLQPDNFRAFFITGTGWGQFEQRDSAAEIRLDYGSLTLRSLRLQPIASPLKVRLNDAAVVIDSQRSGDLVEIHFEQEIMLTAGDTLRVEGV